MKVTLRDSKPPIWRRFVVPSDADLGMLHTILQAIMDWTNSHLHQFEIEGRRVSDPAFELDEFEGDEPTLDEHAMTLQDVAPSVGDRLVYEYDFGDGWYHDIVVEDVSDVGERGAMVWCLDGARACPPDDCGGIPGYEHLLEAIANRRHPDHEQMITWVGGKLDPEAFDRRIVNRELTRWVLSRS